jgi:hypothetical protein
MAIYQGSITIQATSFVGTAALTYQVDNSPNTWDIDGTGLEYAVSSDSGVNPTIAAWHICQGQIYINAQGSLSAQVIKTQISAIAQNYAPEDGLTLSVDEDGNWSATLDTYFWSDLGQVSVYPGFQIVCGNGLAVITEDPQYHVRTVGVDIVSPFALWYLYPDEWFLYIPLGTDFNRNVYSPNYFRRSDLLSAYFNDIQKYLVSESQYLTHRAGDLRKWNKIPADFLLPLLSTLGSFLRLDMLDSEGRRRLAFEWIRFLLYAGTEYFVDFLGYIYNTHFGVEALWTNDYRSFISFPSIPIISQTWSAGIATWTTAKPHGLSVGVSFRVINSSPADWNGNFISSIGTADKTIIAAMANNPGASTVLGQEVDNSYYPTNHVALTYKPEDWDTSNYDQWSLIVDSFYKLASVPLVLQTLSGKSHDDMKLYLIVADHTQHDTFSWSPPLIVASTTLYFAMVDYRHIERSSYSPPLRINTITLYMVMVYYRHKEWSDYSPLLEITRR